MAFACWASALSFEPCPTSLALSVFFFSDRVLSFCLWPRLQPTSASQVVGITGVQHHVQL
jgi:hypothetical protein